MKHPRSAIFLGIVTLVVLLGTGLGACGERRQTQTVTLVWTREFDALNPLYTRMWEATITQPIWNCRAWNWDEENNPRPVLVQELPTLENGGIAANGRVMTLRLRDDIVWSDGRPITSADFLFTYQMAIAPGNAVVTRYPYDHVAKVEAPDERTVVVTFAEPFAPWQGTLWRGLLPAHILAPVYQRAGTIDNAEWNRKPLVGCGPFVFSDWTASSFVRFVANERYWLGRPAIDELVIRFASDHATQVAALRSGSADLGAALAYPDIPTLQDAGLTVLTTYAGYNEGLYFYLDPQKGHPALQDLRVRQAIALGFDRAAFCQEHLLGLTRPAASTWDNTTWVDPALAPWPYDPDRARALLDAAGWIDSDGDGVRDKDGIALALRHGTTTSELRHAAQLRFQEQMAAIGVRIEAESFEDSLFFADFANGGPVATGQLDLYEYSSAPRFPDPDTAEWLCAEVPGAERAAGRNWTALCDTALDALFKAQSSQMDPLKRQATFQEITRYIHENVYWLGLWQDPDLWAVGSRLRNVRISAATPFFNVREWELVASE